jgi:hypothetical protein
MLACVPQTTGLYDALPLFLLCQSRWEAYGLAGLSHVAAYIQNRYFNAPGMVLEVVIAQRWPTIFLLLWLPALLIVLAPWRDGPLPTLLARATPGRLDDE